MHVRHACCGSWHGFRPAVRLPFSRRRGVTLRRRDLNFSDDLWRRGLRRLSYVARNASDCDVRSVALLSHDPTVDTQELPHGDGWIMVLWRLVRASRETVQGSLSRRSRADSVASTASKDGGSARYMSRIAAKSRRRAGSRSSLGSRWNDPGRAVS